MDGLQLQRLAHAASMKNTTTVAASGYPPSVTETMTDQFPAGLRVLVVDDDKTLLKILEQMLRRCSYNVTICSQATVALNLLRERKGYFDVMLSDVHMPDMDGFKLLELVGLEMDLPVIMMSADQRTSIVMKGIRHGACDYLIKPIREEELKNLWQHVVRKKWNENREHEHSGSLEDSDRHKRGADDPEYNTSVNEGTEGMLKGQKKRNNSKEEDDGESENDDQSTSKKPRVVWSVELHQQFVSAVNQLGIDKAVPKRILELMNVPGLTRENVASHLQKFRLYLKRLSGVAQQGGSGIPNPFCGPVDPNVKLGSSLGRFDIRALAASGQIPPQTLAALHAELLGRPTCSLVLPTMDQPALLQASLQGSKCIPIEHGVAFGQPLMKCQSSISKHFPQSIMSVDDVSSGFGAWPANSLGTGGPSGNIGELNNQNGNILMDLMQQQQQSILPESSRSINVQPSCVVVPSLSSASFHMGNSSDSFNQNSNYTRSAIIDYSLISSQANNSSLSITRASDGAVKGTGVLSGYSGAGPISPSLSSCSMHADNGTNQQVRNTTMAHTKARLLPQPVANVCKIQNSYDLAPHKSTGFVGKGICIPSRFAVDELESPKSNLSHGKIYGENYGNKVKEEPNPDFMGTAKVGYPISQHFTPNDLMSVFSEWLACIAEVPFECHGRR